MAIDPTARVASGARIGEDVEVGPYCLVGPQVELASGVRLIAHVNVTGATSIGADTVVYPFSSLGTPPQSVHYRGGATRLIIRTKSAGAGSALCADGNPSHPPSANSNENGNRSFNAAIRHSHRRTMAASLRVIVEKIHTTPEQQQDCHR